MAELHFFYLHHDYRFAAAIAKSQNERHLQIFELIYLHFDKSCIISWCILCIKVYKISLTLEAHLLRGVRRPIRSLRCCISIHHQEIDFS